MVPGPNALERRPDREHAGIIEAPADDLEADRQALVAPAGRHGKRRALAVKLKGPVMSSPRKRPLSSAAAKSSSVPPIGVRGKRVRRGKRGGVNGGKRVRPLFLLFLIRSHSQG